MEPLRIFVSSPGDVAAEREKAREVIDRLGGEFRGRVELHPFLWEDEPQDLTSDFQGNIPPVDKFDIVICILWSRLGTRLGSWHARPDGGTWDSGTEMELMTAIEARKKNGGDSPSVHVFLNTSTPHTDLDDSILQKVEQRAKLKAFLNKLVKDQTEEVWKRAHTSYRTLDEFEKVFENHLRTLIFQRLRGKDAAWVKARPVEWRSCPFRGLRSFDFEHASIFFGRTRAIDGVVNILRRQEARSRPFALILGMSGGGKSSLARAGVVPLLVRPGVIENVGVWRRAAFRPAESAGGPVEALAAALLRTEALPEMAQSGQTAPKFAGLLKNDFSTATTLMTWALHLAAEKKKEELLKKAAELRQKHVQEGRADDVVALDEQVARLELPKPRFVLVVDQLEELFTLNRPVEERDAFVTVLHALVTEMNFFVIATLRSDFYHRYQEMPKLVELAGETGRFDLVRPTFTELTEMVRLPAQAAGLQFASRAVSSHGTAEDESLPSVMCSTAAQDPASLPLLQFCLEELYRTQAEAAEPSNVLTFEAYEKLGGVEGALAKRAADTLAALPADVKAAFGPVMQRLVSLLKQRDGEVAAKKTVRRDDLPANEATRKFVDSLIDARLIVADADSDGKAIISLAHEALLVRWKDLAAWISDHRDFLTLHDRIAQAADRWHEQEPEHRHGFLLPDGRQLAEGVELLEHHRDSLRDVEVDFIRQSIARNEHLAAAAREQARIAKEQAHQAREALAMSDYLQAVEKHFSTPPAAQKIVIAHLVRALRMVPAHPLAGPFLASLLANCPSPLPLQSWRCFAENESGTTVASAGLSPNREVVVCFGPDGAMELRRRTGEQIYHQDHGTDQNHSVSLQFSQSGRLLALIQWDTVRLLHGESGQEACPPLIHQGEVTCAALSPEGHRVATGEQALQNILTLWDSSSGQTRWQAPHPDAIHAIAYAPDGTWLATSCEDGILRFWDAETGREIRTGPQHDNPLVRILVSPTGSAIAGITGRKELHLLDAKTSRPLFPSRRLPDTVDLLLFSPDGHRLLVGCRNGAHFLWSTRSGRLVNEFSCAAAALKSVSLDFSRLAVVSPDGELTIWDMVGTAPQIGPFTIRGQPVALGFGLDGRTLCTIARDGRYVDWDVGRGEMLPVPLWHRGKVASAHFSPDGARVLTASPDGSSVWDAREEKPLAFGLGATGMKQALFSPNGSTVAAVGLENRAYLWQDFPASSTPRELVHDGPINGATFAPDGQMLVTTSDDRSARVWSSKTGLALLSLNHESAVQCAGFSADGSRVATASWTFAFAWSVATGEKIAGPFRHTDKVLAAKFDSSGERLLTLCQPGVVRLWEIASGKILVERSHRGRVSSILISPDGESVLTIGEDGPAHLWNSRSGIDLINPLVCSGPITCAAFDASGRWIALGCQDGTVHVRDTATGLPVCVIYRHASPVRQVEFSPDAGLLLVRTHGCVHLWSLPSISGEIPEQLLRFAENLAAVKFDARTKLLRPLTPGEVEEAVATDRSLVVSDPQARTWDNYLAWLERGASARTVHPFSPVSREEHVRNLAKAFSLAAASSHALADREFLAELGREIPRVEQLASALGMSGLLSKLRQAEVRVLVGLKDRPSLERALSLDPKNARALRMLADLSPDARQAASLRDRATQIESRKSDDDGLDA